MLYVAIIGFLVALAIAIFLYFRPKFISEGFTTIAIDGETIPKCLLRDTEAQYLLKQFQSMKQINPTADSIAAYDELTLILQKVLCMDADVTGPAAGPYSTFKLPFANSHDIEPVASIVGRCVRKSTRERDIEMMMDKFNSRGTELINRLCDNNTKGSAVTSFRNILARMGKTITAACVAPKTTLDTPPGARDPGYYEPESVKNFSPYTIMGERQYF
jgi:hypothetical protein